MTEANLIKLDEKMKIQIQNEFNINSREFLLRFLKEFKTFVESDFINFLKENKTEMLIDIIWFMTIESEKNQVKSQIIELVKLLVVRRKIKI
jgi:hypothetical protein